MGAVGKIQAGDVQALQTHGLENGGVLAGRSDGADDLGFSHGASPSYMIIVFIVQRNLYDDFTVEAAKTQGKKQGIA